MTRIPRLIGLLLIVDFSVSALLMYFAPDKTHSAMTCFSEALAK